MDETIIGFKCIHSLNNKRANKVRMTALKLDMSKAYDKVELNYL